MCLILLRPHVLGPDSMCALLGRFQHRIVLADRVPCSGKIAQMSRSHSSRPAGDCLAVGLNLGGRRQRDSLLPAMHFKRVQGRGVGNSAIEIVGP